MFFHAIVTVIRNGNEQCINSEYVQQGDLVVVTSASYVPCDLVLLHSSSAKNICFVNTANLDGETNLKPIFAPTNYNYNLGDIVSHLDYIVCERPTPDLYKFNGRIEIKTNGTDNPEAIPLTIENLLLRGVRIRGPDRAVGCAIYTGMFTKLQLNSRYTGNKSASSEHYINKFIIALIVGMVAVVLILYLIER